MWCILRGAAAWWLRHTTIVGYRIVPLPAGHEESSYDDTPVPHHDPVETSLVVCRGDLTNAKRDRQRSFLPRSGIREGRRSDYPRMITGVLYRVLTVCNGGLAGAVRALGRPSISGTASVGGWNVGGAAVTYPIFRGRCDVINWEVSVHSTAVGLSSTPAREQGVDYHGRSGTDRVDEPGRSGADVWDVPTAG